MQYDVFFKIPLRVGVYLFLYLTFKVQSYFDLINMRFNTDKINHAYVYFLSNV